MTLEERVGRIIVDRRPRCPTCGHLVHVQSADEGTSYYEPDESDVQIEAADLADTFCYLRAHHHQNDSACAPSRSEAVRVLKLIALRKRT